MNALTATLKAAACGLGALAITAVMSWSFVQSTGDRSRGRAGGPDGQADDPAAPRVVRSVSAGCFGRLVG